VHPAATRALNNNVMVTKAGLVRMVEMRGCKMADGTKELSVANAAIRSMDTNRASN
jgi:hypothetical protein